jgi:hypothetical protein
MGRPIKRLTAGALSICMICLLLYGLKHKATMDAQRAHEALLTAHVVRIGIWNAHDYEHYTDIGDKSATLSNEDFQWLMTRLAGHVRPPQGDQAAVDSLVIAELCDARLTPSQSDATAKAAIPLLGENDPHWDLGVIQEYACKLLQKYHNKAAVPRLLILLNSPHPFVQYHARLL